MSPASLEVQASGRIVGELDGDDDGRMRFTYHRQWLAWAHAYPVSVSLPLGEETFAAAGHRFFANLLPEGPLRESVCRQLKISPDNDLALLAALGEDCAGALVVVRHFLRPHFAAAHASSQV